MARAAPPESIGSNMAVFEKDLASTGEPCVESVVGRPCWDMRSNSAC